MVDYDALVGTPVPEVDPEDLKAELKYTDDFLATHGPNCLDATREATPDTFPIMHRARLIWALRYLGVNANVTRAHGEDRPELAILERVFVNGSTEKMFEVMAKVSMAYPEPNVIGIAPLDFSDLERLYDAA